MSETLDTLQIEIAANASKAAKQIQKLSAALADLKSNNVTATLQDIAKSIKEIGEASSKTKSDDMTEIEEKSRKAASGLAVLMEKAKALRAATNKKIKDLGLKKFNGVVKGAFKPLTGLIGTFKSLARAMGRIALYRAMRSVIKEITQAAKEGVGNLYQWSVAIGGATARGKTFAEIMDAGASSLQYLKNAFGTAFGSIIMSFGNALDGIADKVVTLINRFNNLLAVMRGDSSYNAAIRNNIKYAESANKAAKAIQNLVFGFDELNIIPAQNGSGGGAADNYAEMFTEVPVDQTDPWIAKLEELKSKWEEYGNTIANIRETLWPKIVSVVTACGAAVAALLGHPKIAAMMLGISLASAALGSNWDNVDTLGEVIGKLTASAIKVIAIAGAAYLALKGHPYLAATVLGIGLTASYLIDAWDGTLSGLPGVIAKLTGYAISIASIVGGLYLALHGHVEAGLALMAVGVVVGIATASWDEHTQPISALVGKIAKIVTPMAFVLGGLYALITGHVLLGLGLLATGGIIIAMESGDGWAANAQKVKDGVKRVWDSVTGFWKENIAPVFTQEWWDEKWDENIKSFDYWIEGVGKKFEELKKAFSNGAKNMINALITKFNLGAEKLNNSRFLSTLNSIGGYFGSETTLQIPTIPLLMAQGGIPPMGSMFIAGESGPEFVGSVGGQTSVYNEDQLAQTLAASNEGLINTILAAANALIGAIDDKDLSVNIGDREIAASAARGSRLNGRAMVQ